MIADIAAAVAGESSPRQPFKPPLSPSALAQETLIPWARQVPRVDVIGIATFLGISRIVSSEEVEKDGGLEVRDGDVVISVRPMPFTRLRFTIAHEICHYLLAVKCNVTFSVQHSNRSVEIYCDQFASNILIPRPWLKTQAPPQLSFSSIFDIAQQTKTSPVVAGKAIIEVIDPRAMLIVWRQDRAKGSWYISHCVGGRRSHWIEASSSSHVIFDHLKQGSAASATIPVLINSSPANVECELLRQGSMVLMLVGNAI